MTFRNTEKDPFWEETFTIAWFVAYATAAGLVILALFT